VANAQSVRGIWYLTWSGSVNVGDSNLGVAFSGWVDPDSAISSSQSVVSKLKGSKFLAMGGGNGNGHWTSAILQKISSYCANGKFAGYNGIAFDIEEGDAGLASAFANAFSSCKSHGFKVLVTVSHAAPYGIPDAKSLMLSLISNGNVDYHSPQLYTSGTESANDFSVDSTIGVTWNNYKPTSGKLIPAIVASTYYSSAKNYFANLGITTVGFVQWSQTAGIASSSSGTTSTVRCGADWGSANSGCGSTCATNADCPSGQSCFASLNACSGNSNSNTNSVPVTLSSVRCGADWNSANTGCGNSCATNADCAAGTFCFASLSTQVTCTSAAITDNSQSFSGTTPVNGNELSPAAIVLIVGGILFVLIVVVLVFLVFRPKKIVEQA